MRLLNIYPCERRQMSRRDVFPNNILTHVRADVNAHAGDKGEEFPGKGGQKRGGARIYLIPYTWGRDAP